MNAAISITITALVAMSLYAGHIRAEQFDWYRTQLAMEENGRVMIYNGLRDIEVQRVLDEQFDRIESMMFTGTVVTDKKCELVRNEETGEILVENNGC